MRLVSHQDIVLGQRAGRIMQPFKEWTRNEYKKDKCRCHKISNAFEANVTIQKPMVCTCKDEHTHKEAHARA